MENVDNAPVDNQNRSYAPKTKPNLMRLIRFSWEQIMRKREVRIDIIVVNNPRFW